jgi:Cu(I)/Ag(I) efflux system membrane fusion protein
MKTNWIYAALALAVAAIALVLFAPRLFPEKAPADARHAESPHAADTGYYTCPMHPSVRSDRPGACPVCGMALVKRTTGTAEPVPATLADVSVSPAAQVLANVTLVAARRATLTREIAAVGTIDDAEPSLAQITLRYPGRIERLRVRFTGARVEIGTPVVDVYSPEAISAQREYLLALESVEMTQDAYQDIAEGAQSLLGQSAQKLSRWGFTKEQIAALAETKEVRDTLTVYSPVAGTVVKKYAEPQQYLAAGSVLFDVADRTSVWLMAEIYEGDLPLVTTGMAARATAEAYPGETFRGTVGFIDPVIDPSSRTARARISLPNPTGRLRSGMFLHVALRVPLSPSVVVPASAVLSTGRESVVWLKHAEGVFRPRRVTLGARAGEEIQVLDGVAAGDSVVATGGYLLDSESQLQFTPSGEQEEKQP